VVSAFFKSNVTLCAGTAPLAIADATNSLLALVSNL